MDERDDVRSRKLVPKVGQPWPGEIEVRTDDLSDVEETKTRIGKFIARSSMATVWLVLVYAMCTNSDRLLYSVLVISGLLAFFVMAWIGGAPVIHAMKIWHRWKGG